MAADKATRTYEQIAEQSLAGGQAASTSPRTSYGTARGDELPEHLTRREGRRAWLREAKQRLDAERAERGESIPMARPP